VHRAAPPWLLVLACVGCATPSATPPPAVAAPSAASTADPLPEPDRPLDPHGLTAPRSAVSRRIYIDVADAGSAEAWARQESLPVGPSGEVHLLDVARWLSRHGDQNVLVDPSATDVTIPAADLAGLSLR
jgi:hypothetical protein